MMDKPKFDLEREQREAAERLALQLEEYASGARVKIKRYTATEREEVRLGLRKPPMELALADIRGAMDRLARGAREGGNVLAQLIEGLQ